MFKHILVPTDGSELSNRAVEGAVSFAREAGAKVTFLFAKPGRQGYFFGEGALEQPMEPDRFAALEEQHAQDILRRAAEVARKAGVACTTLSEIGDAPHTAIIKAADDSGCDVIFMASHGRRGVSALLLGSETLKVLTHSSIPVLVYR